MITAALTSFGAAIVRPIVSASKNVNAPKNAENGISILWLLPTKILPICGTINPRKLIAPATAVEILASKTATSEITILVTLTFTPKLLAVLSSRDNRLHSCVNNIARNNPATTYGSNQILKDISLMIKEGKITTIMGANGCGKSTLFSLMTKNLNPNRGKVFLHGKNIKNLKLNEFARKVSIVHQYNQAADDITVERLISYGRTPYMKLMGGKSEEDEKLIDHAIEVTGLEEFRNRELSQLSGGQRQRVFIAMALAQNTKILFLDEPTTYLDIRYQLDILRLVKKLNREYGITIVMVLHEINQAIHFSDEVIGLKDGKVLVQGDPKDVITTESISELYDVHLNVADIDGQKFVLTV